MLSLSYEEFKQLVTLRQASTVKEREIEHQDHFEKVLLPNQEITFTQRAKRLASCPVCDALVDADILHPHSGLCPICHDEARRR